MRMAAAMSTDIEYLKKWIGRTDTVYDSITLAPARGLNASLDYSGSVPQPGEPLPPLWHWLYFLPQYCQSELGPDGHEKRGRFLPPVPFPRRMWAGGRYEWVDQLRIGEQVSRKSIIQDIFRKRGRGGELLFVVVRHEVSSPRGLALTEWHDIVYRQLATEKETATTSPIVTAPDDFVWFKHQQADPVLLFRYSALTFNGHRIHYDRSYVTDVEGYPGLVVHGPLMATLLMQLARDNNPGRVVSGYSFRAIRPVFDGHPFDVCGKPDSDDRSAQMWIRDHDRALAMQATVTFS